MSTKKNNTTIKEITQLSLEFPKHNYLCSNSNKVLNDNVPVISLYNNHCLSDINKSNYIDLILNNTKSF